MKTECNDAIAEALPVKLRPDLVFFPLDDDVIAFCEASQSLIGLNAVAGFLARELQKGTPLSQLADAVVSQKKVTVEEARVWVKASRDAFGSQGLLVGSEMPSPAPVLPSVDVRQEQQKAKIPPYTSFTPAAEGRYRLLGTRALVRYGHLSQKRMVESVIGHLACNDTAPPTVIIDVKSEFWTTSWNTGQLASNIYCDGKPDCRAIRLSSVGPMVKSVLWTIAVNSHDFLLDLHAGVVGEDGRCILLPAAPGSGKSSLTSALAHSGLGYYSDEVALVERGSFGVVPVPLAICVKNTGWDLMARYYPQLPDLPTHRRGDDKLVRYVPPPAQAIQNEAAQVSHIFFPLYSKDEPTRLTPLTRSAALARLMDQCLAFRMRLDPASVKQLVRWIEGIDCYALPFSSLDEAVKLVRDVAFQK
jgi:hypothetical protein